LRLIRQPEIAYITEEGRTYGEKAAPRMAWEAGAGYLFLAGWEPLDIGIGTTAIGERISSYRIRLEGF
jgi:hypothetical protein